MFVYWGDVYEKRYPGYAGLPYCHRNNNVSV